MNSVISLVFLITRFVVTNVCTRAGFCDFCKKEICWKVFKTTYDIIWQINLKEGMLVWFRCCLDLRHFPHFKKNYPFCACLVVGVKRACYRFSPVLDLLHAHRVSFSVLRTCQRHLFATRISLCSIRPQIRSADNPLSYP